MPKRKLPHNSRKIPARLPLTVLRLFVWTTAFSLFIFSYVYILSTPSSFDLAKLDLLRNPSSASAHYRIGREYLAAGATKEATKELTLAQQLARESSLTGQVLGASTNLLEEIQNAPKKIEQEITFWQGVANRLTDYRDAYLQLSALTYELNRLDEAKQYLQKALDLDPNNPISQKLQEFFSQFPPLNQKSN